MCKWILVLACITLQGCATWNRETIVEESVYQGLHAVDTAQTINIRKQWLHGQSMYESDAKWAIGREPSEGRVIAYMAAGAIIHAGITELMVRNDAPKWAIRTWEGLTIGITVDVIERNYCLGIKF